jgi:hypothetical protein
MASAELSRRVEKVVGHLMPGSEAEGAAVLDDYLARPAEPSSSRARGNCTADCTAPSAA